MPRVLLDASGAKSGKIHMNNDDGCNTNKKFASESFDKTIIKICQGTSPLHKPAHLYVHIESACFMVLAF